MKKTIALLLAVIMCVSVTACGTGNTEAAKTETVETEAADAEEKTTGDGKTLVVYFSYTGHLDSMAHWIADESGADLVRVTAKEAYPEDYDETVDRAKKDPFPVT